MFSAQPVQRNIQKALLDQRTAQAVTTAIATEIVLSGKANQTNLERAFWAVERTFLHDSGPYQRTLSIASAIRDSTESLQAISDFAKSLWSAGFDLRGRNLRNGDFDPSLDQAIVADGVIVDYFLSRELREHARTIAENTWSTLKKSQSFCDGLEALRSGPPASPLKFQSWDNAVRSFDRDILAVSDSLRWAVLDSVLKAHPEKGPGDLFLGPTVWTERAMESLVLTEVLRKVPADMQHKLSTRYSKILNACVIRDYHLPQNKVVKASMEFFADLPARLQAASVILSQCLQFKQTRLLAESVALPAKGSSAALGQLSAPPKYTVSYAFIQPAGEEQLSVDLHLIHSIAFIEVQSSKTQKSAQWALDIKGVARSWLQHVPFDETDLDVSRTEFEVFSAELAEGTLAILDKVVKVWERFPDLYTAPIETAGDLRKLNYSDLYITETSTGLTFKVRMANRVALFRALVGDGTSAGGFEGRFEIRSYPEKDSFEIELVDAQKVSKVTEVSCEEAPKDHLRGESGLSEKFLSTYCAHYSDFVRCLKNFDVTEIPGKGSHVGLRRHGKKYSMSENRRDGTLPINRHLVREVLSYLRIDEAEFVRRLSRTEA